MIVRDSPYQPPRWLRNPHLQSMLASSPLRGVQAQRALAASGATHDTLLVDGGEGIRLQGVHSHRRDRPPRGLVVLLHGWEGSSDSNYMRLAAAALLTAGFDVFRLNFRDHGGTHHLNEDLFHSNRTGEVVQAVADVARRIPVRPLLAAGYSLGGSFALRLAVHAPAAGIPLQHVAAVCPPIDPERTMTAMETGFPLYERYFRHKWTRSLRHKQGLYPQKEYFGDWMRRTGLRDLTEWLVRGHTEFPDAATYFDSYNIGGDRLAAMRVPVDVLTAADDPVIPVADFHSLAWPDTASVEIAAHGGHCGFLRDARLHGYAETWLLEKLEQAASVE